MNKKEKHIVYKVVRLESGKWCSAVVTEPEAKLTYALGKTTKALPNSIGVLVFDTLWAAHRWDWLPPSARVILRCETEDAPQKVERLAGYNSVLPAIRVFSKKKASWARRLQWVVKDLYRQYYRYTPPAHTYAVRSVTPIEVVK